MAKVERIIEVVRRVAKDGKEYWVTVAEVSGEMVEGYGNNYKVGEEVMMGYHDKFHKPKMWKKRL